jgi:hypothetical protein
VTAENSTAAEFIGFDWAGWNDSQGRFTHIPSGETLLCQRHWDQAEWDRQQLVWFNEYSPDLKVYDCPGAYNTDGKLLGTLAEICSRLERRLGVIQ